MNKNIFVTGATGLVGSYLVRHLLAQGKNNIRALRRSESNTKLVADFYDLVTWVEGDILDLPSLEDAMDGVQQVYHCAAMVSFEPRNVARMMKVNVEGTANVVNTAMFRGVEKLVHVSSIAAIGRNLRQPDVTENSKWQRSPINSNYAISKYLAEQEVWRGSVEGLAVGIVNPSVVIGAGDWSGGSAALFQRVSDGLKYYSAGATGFVAAQDVARFMVLLMESEMSEERYILNGENQTYQWFFEKVAQALGKNPPTFRVTSFLSEVAWRIEWLRSKLTGKDSIITKETSRTAQHRFFYDNNKSKTAFNFEYTAIEKAIADTAAAFKKEHG